MECTDIVCHYYVEKGICKMHAQIHCHSCGERGHKKTECSKCRKRRASSEGDGSASMAAGEALSAAKTSSAVFTYGTPGKRVLVLKLLPVLGNQIVVLIARVLQTVVVAVLSLVEAMQTLLQEGLQSQLQ